MQRDALLSMWLTLLLAVAVVSWASVAACRAQSAATTEPAFELTARENRIVLVGGGLIEQARLAAYIDTRLLRQFPDRSIICRNLGWSGDSVTGAARTAGFEKPAGLDRLVKEATALNPTVIFVGYGFVESFEGDAALGQFTQGYNLLLDALSHITPRLVLLSPTCHERRDAGDDASEQNKNLEKYTAAIAKIAAERNLRFVDLFHPLLKFEEAHPKVYLTSNGITPNEAGYWILADEIERQLGLRPEPCRIELAADGKVISAQSANVTPEPAGESPHFRMQRPFLPAPALPEEMRASDSTADNLKLGVRGLPAGRWALLIDNHEAAQADARDWDAGVFIQSDPDQTAVEKLRQALIQSSALFYRRERPFNDHSRHWTYIGGDFALYDQQLAELDNVIVSLRQPISHECKMVRKSVSKP